MKNFLLDGILLALFVAEMSFHHLPKILHEIFGVAFTAALVVHFCWNRRRFFALTKNLTPRKFFALTTNFALTICAAVTATTGVFVSNFLFTVSSELRRNMTIHQLHVAAPYLMMILLGVHVGLHWAEIRQRLLKIFGTEKILRAAILLLSALGAAGLILNRVADRILMHHIFGTPATELHGAIFALMTLGGVIFFALITFLLDKKSRR